MTWQAGRQLATYSKGDKNISYTYDADGLRTTKTVNGTKSTYFYIDGQLMYEKNGDKEIYFWYNESGHLAAVRKNTRKTQGDGSLESFAEIMAFQYVN